MSKTHDQNFKNLILDYPIEAIKFFAPQEATHLEQPVKVVPLRQEQLKKQLGNRYRELDTPLLLEWPDGRKEAMIFLLEEESVASRFSISRYAHYCLDIYELYKTNRIVPIVIFLKSGHYLRELNIGSDDHSFLNFNFIACELSTLDSSLYFNSDNIVARLNLPLMCYNKEQKVEVYAQAIDGLVTIEPVLDQQLKYLDFIEQYAELTPEEQQQYHQFYMNDEETGENKMGLKQFLREEGRQEGRQQGRQEGRQQGRQEGEIELLLRLMQKKFVTLPGNIETKIKNASREQIKKWSDKLLTANKIDEVFH